MRESFEYWYPMDLRCSGKDLIKNHLTMCLYNHLYIWGRKHLPKGIFCNGWILVDGEKMSKSKGNFVLLSDANKAFSSDAMRITLADAKDSTEDANF
jgi:leucyl-tRNA synthetase